MEKIKFRGSVKKLDNDCGSEWKPCYPRRNFIDICNRHCEQHRYRENRRFLYVQQRETERERFERNVELRKTDQMTLEDSRSIKRNFNGLNKDLYFWYDRKSVRREYSWDPVNNFDDYGRH